MTESSQSAPADLLATIIAATRRIVEVRAAREPMSDLAERTDRLKPRPGAFRAAVSRVGHLNIIAECKRRSPSRGVLRPAYDAAEIARGYSTAGAAAISVLTEPTFFDGSLKDLQAVRAAVATPLLRKDFIVSEYQLFEARAYGADAVLLIVAALSAADLQRLMTRAASLDLDVLVEVHTPDELDVALDAGAEIVGVNNRNLRTLAVNVRVSEELITRIPKSVIAVSESGWGSAHDLTPLVMRGFHAFLVGERFMIEPNPGAALAALLQTRCW
jgi:indole-3-glycerol phosphate synthase